MHGLRFSLPVFALSLWGLLAVAGDVPENRATDEPEQVNNIVIELFVREDSEQCRLAKDFATDLDHRRDGIELKIHNVQEDQVALKRLWSITHRFGQSQAKLPSAYVCQRLFVGFRDGSALEDCLTIHAFVRSGCSYCRDARAYLADLQRRWPAIRVAYYDVVQDPAAQKRLNDLASQRGISLPVVPSFHVAGRLIVGFRGADITGRQIEQIFDEPTSSDSPTGSAAMSRPLLRKSRFVESPFVFKVPEAFATKFTPTNDVGNHVPINGRDKHLFFWPSRILATI